MEKDLSELSSRGDPISGESDYFVDKDCMIPYQGTVIDEVDGVVLWRFDVKDGKRTGLEYIYNRDGKLEQINECRCDLTFGVSKEFAESGDLTSVSVVWNNGYLKSIDLCDGKIEKVEHYETVRHPIPERIAYLLALPDDELIGYEFA